MRKLAEQLYLLSHGKDFAKERDIVANELRILEDELQALKGADEHAFLLCTLQNICNKNRVIAEFLENIAEPDVKMEDYVFTKEEILNDGCWPSEIPEAADYQMRHYGCYIVDRKTRLPVIDRNVMAALYKQLEAYLERKESSLAKWQQYDLVDSEEEFLHLWNILEAHAENLSSLHEAKGNYSGFCGVYGEWKTDREIANALLAQHEFYDSSEGYITVMKENAEKNNMSVEEYMRYEKWTFTLDGIIRHIAY